MEGISCSPLRMWEWNELALPEPMKHTEDQDSINSIFIMASAQESPVLTLKEVQCLSEILRQLVQSLTKEATHTSENEEEMNCQQAKITEWVFE